MSNPLLENTNIERFDPMPSPAEIKAQHPLSERIFGRINAHLTALG